MQSVRVILLLSFAVVLAGCGFDRARWMAARDGNAGDNPRSSMLCEAVAAGLVPGAHKNDIRDLLGPADDGPPADEPLNVDIYNLGVDLGLDTHLLSVSYDDSDIVSEVSVTHDWGSLVLQPRASGDCGGNWTFERAS